MLEVEFRSSKKKLAHLSTFLGDQLSTVPLLKSHSTIIPDCSDGESGKVVDLIKRFLLQEGQSDFEVETEYEKIIIRPTSRAADSWAKRRDSPVDSPPGLYACPHCGQVFSSEEACRLHTIIHYV
jgi:hypothetical protein